ncbi:MAG: hypothetical protein F6K58_00080 [Symploca sp. SIO2E9]|nr:hypothetical protein [Symploca sp. SIO2E9]
MSRRVITTQLQSNFPGTQVDTYFDKVIKYIPADIVGAWVAVGGLINSASDIPRNMVLWIAFAIGLVLTGVWTWKETTVKNKAPAITQIFISTVAFFVWVFALGEPFTTLDFYRPLYGSLLLIFYTLVVALINPQEG